MMRSISGERGVGKTLYLAEWVYDHSRAGYFVVTNFSHSHSNLDCSRLSPSEFWDVIAQIIAFKEAGYEMCDLHPAFWHTGVYVAIDEATLYLSPDQQKRMQSEEPEKYERLLSLLAQARKYDVYIDYVVQDPAKVGKDFRRYTEEYVYFRWVIKSRKIIHLQHPTKPTLRRETRSMIPFVWEEHHNLDTEHPVFNYKKMPDGQWSESSTVISRKIRYLGGKKHVYRMFNSYQPMAVKSDQLGKDFDRLMDFVVVPDTYGRDRFPTFKRIFGIKPRDAELPEKMKPEKVFLPILESGKKAAISEVESQKVRVLTVEELQRQIRRAHAKTSVSRARAKAAQAAEVTAQ